MANEQNLIPGSMRTKSELREITRKGGIASGKARRKKADLRKAFEIILSADVTSDKARAQLESMGLEPTNEMLMALATFQQAAKGNQRAVENIIKLTSTKDKYDISEQRERTRLLKQQRLQAEIETAQMSEEGQDDDTVVTGFTFDRGEYSGNTEHSETD